MARPLTEHSAKLRAGKGTQQPANAAPNTASTSARSRVLEPVEGGRVRRIVFEGTDAEEPVRMEPSHRESDPWAPRHRASMDDIRFEVDNLNRFRTRRQQTSSASAQMETGTVYETDGGSVREAKQGERRVFYTATRVGDRVQERRFSGHVVDEILRKRNPVEEDVVKEESVEYVSRKRRVVEEVVVEPKRRRKADKKSAVVESAFQPQCTAVTKDGLQCRNSSKTATAYCGAHQSYKARSLDEVTDTVPRVVGAEDTLPGKGSPRTTDGKQAQCGAYTLDGMQCRNSSRKTSKYCAVHKGYRAPSRAQLESRLDTKPRHAGAEDTLPHLK